MRLLAWFSICHAKAHYRYRRQQYHMPLARLGIAHVDRRHPAVAIAADAISSRRRGSAAAAFVAGVAAKVAHAVVRSHQIGDALRRRSCCTTLVLTFVAAVVLRRRRHVCEARQCSPWPSSRRSVCRVAASAGVTSVRWGRVHRPIRRVRRRRRRDRPRVGRIVRPAFAAVLPPCSRPRAPIRKPKKQSVSSFQIQSFRENKPENNSVHVPLHDAAPYDVKTCQPRSPANGAARARETLHEARHRLKGTCRRLVPRACLARRKGSCEP